MNATQWRLGWLERALRKPVRWLFQHMFRVSQRAIDKVPESVRVVVLRFDPRLGNQVLLTPLLNSLHAQCPKAHIELVGSKAALSLLDGHRGLARVRTLNKWALFAHSGLFGTLLWLRRQRFDICLDASNPTAPSLTHALLARFSKATHIIGSASRGLGSLRTAPVTMTDPDAHEIDLRLALLEPLGPGPRIKAPHIRCPKSLTEADIHGFLAAVWGLGFGVIHVGARLANKQLDAADYAVIANLMTAQGLTPVISWGPKERALAEQAVALSQTALLAPPTNVVELCHLLVPAAAVVSCDTGPMHLSVALGRPTCGLFVSTSLTRYGYVHAPHAAVETRGASRGLWTGEVRTFLASLSERVAAERASAPVARLRRPPPDSSSWPHPIVLP